MDNLKKLLKEVDLIKELDEKSIDAISEIAFYREYNKGSHVFMENESIKYIYFIANGRVKIYKTDTHGKEQIVSILQSGEMFPHTGFFRTGNYPANAMVTKQTFLLGIPIDSFEKLLVRNPNMAINLFKIMSERIIDLQLRLEEQILHNTYEKVVLLLLRLGDKYGEFLTDKIVKFNIKFTHQELANMIGSSRETLNRTLTQLKKNQILEFDEDGFLIINNNKLYQEINNH